MMNFRVTETLLDECNSTRTLINNKVFISPHTSKGRLAFPFVGIAIIRIASCSAQTRAFLDPASLTQAIRITSRLHWLLLVVIVGEMSESLNA
jgi:hypothetical protein